MGRGKGGKWGCIRLAVKCKRGQRAFPGGCRSCCGSEERALCADSGSPPSRHHNTHRVGGLPGRLVRARAEIAHQRVRAARHARGGGLRSRAQGRGGGGERAVCHNASCQGSPHRARVHSDIPPALHRSPTHPSFTERFRQGAPPPSTHHLLAPSPPDAPTMTHDPQKTGDRGLGQAGNAPTAATMRPASSTSTSSTSRWPVAARAPA